MAALAAAAALSACGGGGGEIRVSVKVKEADGEEAREAAEAFYAAFTQDPSIVSLRAAPAAYAEFRAAGGGDGHSQKDTVSGDPFGDLVDGDGTPDGSDETGDPVGSYEIADANGENALARDGATASVFAPGGTQVTHEVPEDGEFKTPGEWMGVSGAFHCAGDCTSQNGRPTGEGWRFRPGDVTDRVTLDDAVWGWWVATDDEGDITGVTAFHHRGGLGNEDYSGVLNPSRPNRATYEGEATGGYVLPGAAGRFTATASLTATFGPGAGGDTLSGEIMDFMDADNGELKWSVTLEETALSYASGGFDVTGGDTVWTRDGARGAEGGEWRADLYGGDAVTVPTHALGSFLAVHQGSRMIGAFGAEKTGEGPAK